MHRITYVNGEYLPEAEAKISIFDRGFLMADAIYEVTCVVGGKLLDFAGHMARLRRSLDELRMEAPAREEELLSLHRELVRRNALDEGHVYMQVTRGVADRDFLFPPAGTKPTLVMFTQAGPVLDRDNVRRGMTVVTVPDLRWARRDIKTVQLLAPSLAKMEAKRQGADDAWMVDEDGLVTEGSSNNAYIVVGGKVVTRHLSNSILHGITRAAVMKLASETGVGIEERGFTVAEAKNADEAFITSASTFVTPVVAIDGAAVGAGVPGPVAKRMREVYVAESLKRAI